ncbi:MAG: hypothetical protein V1781_07140 [Bacteroidota bacterium]
MREKALYIIVGIIFTVFFWSCIKKIHYSSVPHIEYEDFIRYGKNIDSVELVISFTDEEGDIGLDKADTQGIFKNGNLWMIYYYDSNGTWAAHDTSRTSPQFDTLKIGFRVPPLLPPGDPDEPMKGLIYVKQNPFINFSKKIMYEIYLYDKAMHKSEKIKTPAIYLN